MAADGAGTHLWSGNLPMADPPRCEPHRLDRICHAQAPDGFLQLAKIIDNCAGPGGHICTLVRWIDVRRDAEWVPTYTIPVEAKGEADEP